MSQSVRQCIAVDLFPHILANVVDIQKVHLLLHTPLLNKTPKLSSARTFVRLYRPLLIHCIYVSVIKPTCPAFSAWLITGAIRYLKVTGKTIMLCSYGITIKVTCMCSTTWPIKCWFNVWLQAMRKFDLSVLVEILSGVDSDHGTSLRRNGSVNSRSKLCPIERGHVDQRRSFKLSSGWLRFVNWTFFLAWPCKPQNFISF